MEAIRHLVFVIYDGIQNSVFQSQILQPLLKRLDENPVLHITLISYERNSFSYQTMASIIPALDRFDVIIARRMPFLGRASLLQATRTMRKMLEMLSPDYCIARGPLAGYVVLKAYSHLLLRARRGGVALHDRVLPPVVVQARGLAAEEFRYTKMYRNIGPINKIIFWGLYGMLRKVEEIVYGNKLLYAQVKPVRIESVSRALKHYLEENFNANPRFVEVVDYDVPVQVPSETLLVWRKEIRELLRIPLNAAVYCYSGSYKPWQCIDETMLHFMQVREHDPRALLLILSEDEALFSKKIEEYRIAAEYYRLVNVHAKDLLRYLAAADFGYLLRHADIINWVSRPTKFLEYKAAGLLVIHNNTIGMLCGEQDA